MPSVLNQSTPLSPVLGGPAKPEEKLKPPTPPVGMREFGDAIATRKRIYDNVLTAAQNFKPMTNQRHTLELSDVAYSGPERYTIVERKRAVLEGGTLSRHLKGTWTLRDNETQLPVSTKRSIVAAVPYFSDAGTMTYKGTEYMLAHQQRLRAGVYTRIQENGELESHINVKPGTGRSSRIFLDPESGVFRIKIGQAKMPLITLAKALGATDKQLREAWGNELSAINMQKDNPAVLKKLYDRVVRKRDPEAGIDDIRLALQESFARMELEPEVTKRTLGFGYTNMGLDTILATTRKLLAVSRGEERPDDRDHQAYQQLLGPEDLFAERLGKDLEDVRIAMWKASGRGDLSSFKSGIFNRALQATILSSGLGQPLEEINPAEMLDQQGRVTRMGQGGIPSIDSVPEEARGVQPSQFGFIDLIRTPESSKVGVDLRFARAARKGDDGKLYTPVLNTQGKQEWKTAHDLVDAVVALPGEMERGTPAVTALVDGRPRRVDRKRVQYSLPNMEDTFSPLANMIPFKSMMKGQRAVMASRMLTQALPIVNGESPLVRSAVPGKQGVSFEEEYGRQMGSRTADRPGTVTEVTADGMKVKYDDGTEEEIELAQNYPYNRKTFIHQTPTVQAGTKFDAGTLLARSNFTDAAGHAALGLNARTAYIPYKGMNFEDAIVISEGMAKRLSSEHMYQNQLDLEDKDVTPSKKDFMSIFANRMTREQLARYDDHGVIKPGTVVEDGDRLILAIRRRRPSLNRLHKGRKSNFADVSITWDHHSKGVVTDAVLTPKVASVIVKSTEGMQVGDKMSNRYGGKGIVSAIIPDGEMPADSRGRPFEVLLNPLGIISRGNPGQIVETALGKIAEKTGQPIVVPDFDDTKDMAAWALEELAKHGLTDVEDIVDPEREATIRDIMTGNQFFMKLHHTAESKSQARGTGSYTAENVPAKGGKEGAKRIGMLELGALLSHGATDVIRDAKLIRGQENRQYWRQFMSGGKPPTPAIPYVYHKFVSQLKGSGINVVRDGTQVHIMALTDKDIDALAGGRELESVATVDWKDRLKPIKGGLFDEALTGGHNGNKWSQITLHEPMPNPVMEEPIRRMLRLTGPQFMDVLTGRREHMGKTGPEAITTALREINVDREIDISRMEIASGRKTARDAAIRRLGYLKSAKRLGLHPKDWVVSKVPVLPPSFRPVSVMGEKKLPMVADPNFLYKELFDANRNLKDMSDLVDDTADEREILYKAFKGVTGLGDPVHPKNQQRNVRGLLKHIFGTKPKYGVVQRRLLGTASDLVGRAVISPNPDLDMDHVALPEDKAWDVYKPFLVRRLVQRGLSRIEAARAVKDRRPMARAALLQEMDERPVIINRAPTLHRYGMMAFRPRLAKGETLQISPLVVGGFGADFDGDAMQYHIPQSAEAVDEAYAKMLPSVNLFSAADFKSVMYKPSQEYIGGLWAASAIVNKHEKPRKFKTTADAIKAYRRGEIDVGQQVQIEDD